MQTSWELIGIIAGVIAGLFSVISIVQSWLVSRRLKQLEEEKVMSHLDVDLITKIDKEQFFNNEPLNMLYGTVIIKNKGKINTIIEVLEVVIRPISEKKIEMEQGLFLPDNINGLDLVNKIQDEKVILDPVNTDFPTDEADKGNGIVWNFTYEFDINDIFEDVFSEIFSSIKGTRDIIEENMQVLLEGAWEKGEEFDPLDYWSENFGAVGINGLTIKFNGIFAGQEKNYFFRIPFFKTELAKIDITVRSVSAKKMQLEEEGKHLSSVEAIFSDFAFFIMLHLYFLGEDATTLFIYSLGGIEEEENEEGEEIKQDEEDGSSIIYYEEKGYEIVKLGAFGRSLHEWVLNHVKEVIKDGLSKILTLIEAKYKENPDWPIYIKDLLINKLKDVSKRLINNNNGLISVVHKFYEWRSRGAGTKSSINVEKYMKFLKTD